MQIGDNSTIEQMNKEHVWIVLRREGQIGKAAKILGITRRTLSTWLREWRIEKIWKNPDADAGPSAAS
jgi:transcriptional regulator with PAS, ATPase and Fis domain